MYSLSISLPLSLPQYRSFQRSKYLRVFIQSLCPHWLLGSRGLRFIRTLKLNKCQPETIQVEKLTSFASSRRLESNKFSSSAPLVCVRVYRCEWASPFHLHGAASVAASERGQVGLGRGELSPARLFTIFISPASFSSSIMACFESREQENILLKDDDFWSDEVPLDIGCSFKRTHTVTRRRKVSNHGQRRRLLARGCYDQDFGVPTVADTGKQKYLRRLFTFSDSWWIS